MKIRHVIEEEIIDFDHCNGCMFAQVKEYGRDARYCERFGGFLLIDKTGFVRLQECKNNQDAIAND